MNSYVEEILLKVKVNETELEEIKKDFDSLKITELLSPQAKKALEDAFTKTESRAKELEKINKELAKLADVDTLEARKAKSTLEGAKHKLERQDIAKDFKAALKSGIEDAGKKAWKNIEDLAKEVWTEAKKMMQEIAAYSESSQVYSSEATGLKLSYGLSGSQAYAAQQASKLSGFSNFDDFVQNYMYATEETKKRWETLFKKYEETYEQDKEIALTFQEFQLEWQDFKREMSMELINFFMENKDTIKTVMKTLMTFMEVGLQVFGGLAKWLSDDVERNTADRTAATSDILDKYITNNQADYSRSVSISNTFNGVQSSDRNELVNAGALTYQQIKKALE